MAGHGNGGREALTPVVRRWLVAADGRRHAGIAVHHPDLRIAVGGEGEGSCHRLSGDWRVGRRRAGTGSIVISASRGATGQGKNSDDGRGDPPHALCLPVLHHAQSGSALSFDAVGTVGVPRPVGVDLEHTRPGGRSPRPSRALGTRTSSVDCSELLRTPAPPRHHGSGWLDRLCQATCSRAAGTVVYNVPSGPTMLMSRGQALQSRWPCGPARPESLPARSLEWGCRR